MMPRLLRCLAFHNVMLAGLVVVLSVVQAWIYAPNHDQIALLASARDYDLTSRYGIELWEINPPFYLLWLKPALWAQGWFGGTAYLWSLAMQAVLLLGSAMALRSIWGRYYVAATQANFLSIVYVLAVFLLGNFNYPQRETVLVLALAPSLFLLCAMPQAWRQGKNLRWYDKAMLVLAAGLVMIKPHYAVVLAVAAAGVLFVAVKQKQMRWLMGQVKLVILASILLMGGAVWLLLQSGWLDFYLSQKAVYDANGYTAGTNMALAALLALTSLGVAALLYFKARGGKPIGRDSALLGLALLLIAAGYLQGKGFYNHYLPAMVLLFCHAVLLMVQEVAQPKRRLVQAVLLPIVALLPMVALWGLYLVAFALSTTRPLHTALPLYTVLEQIAPKRVMVLSTFIGTPVRMTGLFGAELVQRYPHLWTYPYYARQIESGQMSMDNPLWVHEREAVLQRFLEDARKYKPDVLIIPAEVEKTADNINIDVPQLLAPSSLYHVLTQHFAAQQQVKGWVVFYGWQD
jgi:hypothetical protein